MAYAASKFSKAIEQRSFGAWRFLFIALIVAACISLSGCTAEQEDDTLLALQGALSSLTQNRAIIEQFGRDIQSQVDKQDQQYPELMEQYEESRDAYNQYLEATKQRALGNAQDDDVDRAARAVRDTSSHFIESASRTLSPNTNLRGMAIRNAVDLPPGLSEVLTKIPKKARKMVIEKYMQNLRVRSWGTLTGGYPREVE